MATDPITAEQRETYRANLTALSEWLTGLAQRLEACPIPPSVEPTVGRDGSETFRLPRDDGSCQWLGRSSMPTISAPALVGGFHPDGRNVVLPTIGTGREALLIERSSPPHCAVFVYEPDVLALKLVLHLHDMSDAIRRRRLVLLSGHDVGAALTDFFAACPGFEFPHRMVPLPTLSEAQRERARVLIESAGPRAAREQWSAAVRLKANLSGQATGPPPQAPRVIVLSRDPRVVTVELADQLGHALQQLRWPGACSVPDRPDRCHTVARLEAVRRHKPDMVLLLNCLKGRLAEFLPEDLPVASWLITADSLGAALREGLEGNRTIFITRPDVAQQLVDAGAGADSLHLLEEATDPTVFCPAAVGAPTREEPAREVAVLSDAVDLSAAAAGVTLASQVRLWEQLCSAVARSAGDWHDALADRILAQAERKAGTTLKEAAVRERFTRLIRTHLVPTMLTRSAVERLALGGLEVAVWGSGWQAHPSVKELVRGPIPGPAGRCDVYRSAAVVVCPYFHERTARTILDCLAAGGCPVYRTPETPTATLHPQLDEVLAAVPNASSLDKLVAVAKRLAGNPEARREATAKARTLVLERHTLAHRLRVIRERALGLSQRGVGGL